MVREKGKVFYRFYFWLIEGWGGGFRVYCFNRYFFGYFFGLFLEF